MNKIKIGITGQRGFIGTHLTNYLNTKDSIQLVVFQKEFFNEGQLLNAFVSECDVIIHLAALNRHSDASVIYNTNTDLVHKLIAACQATNSTPHILFSSSTQEESDNLYGKSKIDGRRALEQWGEKNNAFVTGLIIPNVFGPFCKPFYNSVVATFCYQLTHGQQPKLNVDNTLSLIYINELVDDIYKLIIDIYRPQKVMRVRIEPRYNVKVSDILTLLEEYKSEYVEKNIFPDLTDSFKKALFNTFRCYIPFDHYPRPFTLNIDNRGMFVEIARAQTPGQTSFSTTVPGIVRGNHYHTRKAERFAVIKGKALIQLRKIGDNEPVINYELDGAAPAYVDMPVWHTHNIKNIGTEELVTIFWINEPFDAADSDTFFEEV